MAVTLTYTVAPGVATGKLNTFNNRVQSLFQRLGWEHVSQTQFRFHRSGIPHITFAGAMNRFIPTLFCFRVYLIVSQIPLATFTLTGSIEVHHNVNASNAPSPALPEADPEAYVLGNKSDRVTQRQFGTKKLVEWLLQAQSSFPYP